MKLTDKRIKQAIDAQDWKALTVYMHDAGMKASKIMDSYADRDKAWSNSALCTLAIKFDDCKNAATEFGGIQHKRFLFEYLNGREPSDTDDLYTLDLTDYFC